MHACVYHSIAPSKWQLEEEEEEPIAKKLPGKLVQSLQVETYITITRINDVK